MKTQDNLMEAFAGESQANRRYLAFAARADKEGFKNVARIYRAIAEAETVHAHKHLDTAGKVKSTAENLAVSREGEEHEFKVMYPGFIEAARAEEQAVALRSFEYANAAEEVHGGIFGRLLAMVKDGKDHADEPVSLCPVCGWVGTGEPPEKCPICGTLAKVFRSY
jgi:rubrerythrin